MAVLLRNIYSFVRHRATPKRINAVEAVMGVIFATWLVSHVVSITVIGNFFSEMPVVTEYNKSALLAGHNIRLGVFSVILFCGASFFFSNIFALIRVVMLAIGSLYLLWGAHVLGQIEGPCRINYAVVKVDKIEAIVGAPLVTGYKSSSPLDRGSGYYILLQEKKGRYTLLQPCTGEIVEADAGAFLFLGFGDEFGGGSTSAAEITGVCYYFDGGRFPC